MKKAHQILAEIVGVDAIDTAHALAFNTGETVTIKQARDAMKAYALDIATQVQKGAISWVVKGAPLSHIRNDIANIDIKALLV